MLRLTGPPHDHEGESDGLAPVVAIASGKGGVGKTSIAVSLGIALAGTGVRTTLVDADLGVGDVDVLCGINAARHLGHVLDGRATLEEVLIETHRGLRIVGGGSGLSARSTEERGTSYDRAIRSVRAKSALVLIDLGAGLGRGVIDSCADAERVLVVTTPEPTAIADAYALLKTLAHRVGPDCLDRVHLVVNRARGRAEAAETHRRIAAVCSRFLGVAPVYAGCVRDDARVRRSVHDRVPFVLRRWGAASDVRALARRVRFSMLPGAGSGSSRQHLARLVRSVRMSQISR
ncbi:MAG: AAA family ATPase [Planctomycetota bacterium]